jgi:hypothetical protein
MGQLEDEPAQVFVLGNLLESVADELAVSRD